MRRLILLAVVLCSHAFGYASYSGFCEQGGVKVAVAGQNSPLTFQQSYPNAAQSGAGPSVTVYLTGTTTKATIYSDNNGTSKANPFPCTTAGQYLFFADTYTYDLLFAGTGISSFTRASIPLIDPAGVDLVVNVKGFGAKGDGVTDDTLAVRAALAVACAQLGTKGLQFPAGIYISAPPTPGANAIVFNSCTGLKVSGPGTIKVKNSAGLYRSIFEPVSGCSSNTAFEGLTFDFNSSNNPVGAGPDAFRIAIHTGNGSGCINNRITGNRFTGSRSSWQTYVTSEDSTVEGNVYDNIGGGAVDFDTSEIYLSPTALNGIVRGNTVQGSARNANAAKTAIEVQNKTLVADNVIVDMVTGINLVGAAAATVSGDLVTGNLMTGVYAGIRLWSSSTGGASGYGLAEALVATNKIYITQSAYDPLGGAMCGICVEPNQNLPLRNITVSDNDVSFEISASAADPINTASIGIGYYDATSANSCLNCQFPNNRVYNAPGPCYRYAANGTNISFQGSSGINCGSTLNAGLALPFRSGFILGNVLALTGPLILDDMKISDTFATARMAYGMYLGSAAGPNVVSAQGTNVSVSDATATAFVRSFDNEATVEALIRATVNVPSAKALPSPTVKAQSSVYSWQETRQYTWDGFAWDYLVPHPVAPTAQIGGSTTCGTARVIAGTDFSGIVVTNGGAVTSCTVTFGTAFLTQPAISFTQLTNPSAGTGLSFAGTGSPAFSTGFTVTSTNMGGSALTWNLPFNTK